MHHHLQKLKALAEPVGVVEGVVEKVGATACHPEEGVVEGGRLEVSWACNEQQRGKPDCVEVKVIFRTTTESQENVRNKVLEEAVGVRANHNTAGEAHSKSAPE